MSDCHCQSPSSLLTPAAQDWRQSLVDFVDQRARSIPQRDQLSPLQQEQRRVTGGVLLQFTHLLQTHITDRYPDLTPQDLQQRLFLCITDEAGFHAAEDVLETDTEQVLRILKEDWRAFLEAPHTLDDSEFRHHYECWSVWHQNLSEKWDMPPRDGDTIYWVHEEGYALADGIGRGAQHLWGWDGQEFKLIEQRLTSWDT